jgi:hypothetical protein
MTTFERREIEPSKLPERAGTAGFQPALFAARQAGKIGDVSPEVKGSRNRRPLK